MRSIMRGSHGFLGSLSKLADGIRANTDMNRAASLSRGPNLGSKMNAAPWSNAWPAPGATLDLDFANDCGFIRGVGQGKSLGGVTFTRASNAQYIDSTGTLQTAANNVPRFDWASTTQLSQNNIIQASNYFLSAAWTTSNASLAASAVTDPFGNSEAFVLTENGATNNHYCTLGAVYSFSAIAGNQYTISFYAKANTRARIALVTTSTFFNALGTTGQFFDLSAGTIGNTLTGVTASISNTGLSAGWYRCSVTVNAAASVSTAINLFLSTTGTVTSYAGDGVSGLYVYGLQVNNGATALPYVQTGLASNQSNTPLQANPTRNGLLIEESRTNRALWCRDATQASWVNTNITAALNQTGIDGVTNSASSLTASAANGTTIQTVTLASGARASSIYLKKLAGTGAVQVTIDGTTWTTVDLSNGIWNRIALSSTLANPVIGVQIAVSGDAVAMDFAQIEDGAFSTSPILTTSATATRSADLLSISGANFAFFSQQNETLLAAFNASQVSNAPILVGNSGGVGNLLLTSAGLGSQNNGSSVLNTANAYTTTNVGKLAVTGNASRRSVSLNGSIASSNTSVRTTATVANMYLGSNGTAYMNGTLSRIIYFPKAFSDSSLQNLTGQSA